MRTALSKILFTVALCGAGAVFMAEEQAQAITTIIEVSLPTNDLVYDPFSDMIYASVPSSAGVPRGNSITPIDPYTGALGTSVFISSEPTTLAIADDGSRLYAASASTNAVTPFLIPTQTVGSSFLIGGGGSRVDDMEVAPGHPEILAVSRTNGGLFIYSDGVQLPQPVSSGEINDAIEFGSDHTRVYGHVNSISSFNINAYAIDISPTGGVVSKLYSPSGLVNVCCRDFEYDNGRLYFTNGQIFDETPNPVGSFAANGTLEPDSSVDRTFFISDNKLKAFSQTNFLLYGEVPIPGISSGGKDSLIRLDGDGVAFRTSTGEVYIIHSDIVPFNSMYDEADLDHDGDIDTADITKMLQNFTGAVGEAGGKMRVEGDIDGDGDVDTADITVGFQRFTGTQNASPASVPEPSGMFLAAMGLAGACFWWRSGVKLRRIARA